MLEHVMKKQNSHAKRTRCGTEHSAYRANGCVMVILIVWMEQMRMLHYITVQAQFLVVRISSPVIMVAA
jgi:hypothetical protein